MSATDPVSALHATLIRRETPETVGKMVLDALPEMKRDTYIDRLRRIVGLPVRTGFDFAAHQRFGWSSMSRVFRRPDPFDRQLDKARELALLFLGEALPDGADAAALRQTVPAGRAAGAPRGASGA